ncbi:hypothetical protein [Massilia genomosp. 1]|uniref:Uncharacterized protein n=1 Tax=Massilia genomosp. 1 TaxID=2609280 RepID=A0ABX0N5Z1_9BURK|nr:hypothetical protein [Massilia genomosp. 1]NHZ66919.1 hypothetical protein [Massilia genomosp. 1]
MPAVQFHSKRHRADIAELETLIEAAGSAEQRTLIQNSISRFGKTAQEIMGKECKGSVKEVFPGQWKDKTLKTILDASKNGDKTAKTAWKLLNDLRFKK